MPYIKNDDLKIMLKYAFLQGCNAGYGIDHERDLNQQEEEAFEEWYQMRTSRNQRER